MSPRQEPEKTANQATWSVIIGSLLGVVLFLGSAYAGNSLAALVVAAVLITYISVLMAVGRINVFAILWGKTVDEDDADINLRIVTPATIAVALVAVGIFLLDLFGGESWGWFSWIAAAVAIGYLAFIAWGTRNVSSTHT